MQSVFFRQQYQDPSDSDALLIRSIVKIPALISVPDLLRLFEVVCAVLSLTYQLMPAYFGFLLFLPGHIQNHRAHNYGQFREKRFTNQPNVS